MPTRHPIIEGDLAKIVSSPLPWSKFAGKTVLISGASGFLPAYMVETLLYLNETQNMGIQVLGLVRNSITARKRFAFYEGRNDLKLLIQDVCDPISIEGHVDFVIHAASQASPKFYGIDPVGTFSANAIGSHNMLRVARDNHAEGYLFFSSGEVYGQVDPAKVPIREDYFGPLDPTDLRSCYGEGKRAGETLSVAWWKQFGVPAKIVRPAHTYGPGLKLDDGRVFADFISDVVHHRDIVMKSDGSAIRPFCYLADAVVGYFTVLLLGQCGQAYNIANDQCEISILNLAKELVLLFPEKGLRVVRTSVAGHEHHSPVVRGTANISKVRALGWNPTTSIQEGFRRTIDSFSSLFN